jgi:GNAT superfamily N-acetyltransferase
MPHGITHAQLLHNQANKLGNYVTALAYNREHSENSTPAPPVHEEHVLHALTNDGKDGILHPTHLAHLVNHVHDQYHKLVHNPNVFQKTNSNHLDHAVTALGHAGVLASRLKMHPDFQDSIRDLHGVIRKQRAHNFLAEKTAEVPKSKPMELGNLDVHGVASGHDERTAVSLDHDHPVVNHGLRRVFGNKVDNIDQYLHQTYDTGHPDYSVKLHGVKVHHDFDNNHTTIGLAGHVHDADGNEVGRIHREFIRDKNGRLTVHHALFKLDDEHKGQNIGRGVSRSAMKNYKDLGVKEVVTEPAWDGRYVWARMGYNWNHHGARYVRDTMPRFLVRHYGLSQEKAEAIVDRHADKAWKIAALKIGGKPAGKEYLTSPNYSPWGDSDARVELNSKSPGYQHMKKYLNL